MKILFLLHLVIFSIAVVPAHTESEDKDSFVISAYTIIGILSVVE